MREWFVLRRQPVAERDWLLDVFSKDQGVTQVRLSPPTRLIDLHQRCQGDWRPDKDWPRLKGAEVLETFLFTDETLVCALYLDELLLNFLPSGEPVPEVYQLYLNTLQGLQSSPRADVWLRVFEYQLLQYMGLGINWLDSDVGPVQTDCNYTFVPSSGFIRSDNGIAGDILHAIGDATFSYPGALKVARQVLRQAIDAAIRRPLISRELL